MVNFTILQVVLLTLLAFIKHVDYYGIPMIFVNYAVFWGLITGVVMGERGTPGELCGSALGTSPIGSIEENTVRGIFGTSRTPLGTLPAMPVAAESEIRLGEATILSTVGTGGVRSYDAVITRIARSGDGGKLTLTITDGDLLAVTGGIVQGMSGSPILQNGKIVGAVTHVLVNDPTKGYGISMENMLEAAS